MNDGMLNFSLVLVVATLLTGITWFVDRYFIAHRRVAAQEKRINEPFVVDISRSFFPVLLIVLVLRSFIVEPFQIPSGSMLPTLEVGDFILVNKFSYGIRLPVVNTKLIAVNAPARGDIVVFKYPENPNIDYIKRIVGLPGDHIEYRNKVLYINGQEAQQRYDAPYVRTDRASAYMPIVTASELRENLIGVEHHLLIHPQRPDQDYVIDVPADSYFVMGDNRDDSRDSRFWGFLPEQNLVGRAFFIWMHWDRSRGLDGFSWDRLGKKL
ncbi:MAG: signal peptidase I [Gammaproteobacteria bacterium]|nr:signal peptidase I [Gammaproteobacteria bacterium]